MSRKSIASRYLDNLDSSGSSNSGPLQPSSKLNTPSERVSRSSSKLNSSDDNTDNQKVSPVKRYPFDKQSAFSDSTPKIPTTPTKISTRTNDVQQSFANLKLDSPSPLKRTYNKPTTSTTEEKAPPPPQWTISNRKSQKGYEYLCRIGEAKEWIEKIIGEEIPPASKLAGDALRDGVILAKLTKAFKPNLVKRITPSGTKLQFKHTENINVFFQFLDEVRMPDLFRFELTDLYDKKNIPKVIFCVHALSFMLSQENSDLTMEQLSGKLDFSEEDIKRSEGSIAGVNLPNFESMNKQFNRELPKSPQKKLSVPDLQPTNSITPPTSPKRLSIRSPFLDQANDSPQNLYDLKRLRSSKKSAEVKFTPPPVLEKPKTRPLPEEPKQSEDDSFDSELIRGYNASPTKQKKLGQLDYLKTITQFQSIARGSIFRYGMFVDRIMLKSMADSIIQLQSHIRRSLAQKKYKIDVSIIDEYESQFIGLQSLIRAKKQRSFISEVNDSQPNDETIMLQCLIRGHLIRRQINELNTQLKRYDHKIIKVQSLIRRKEVFDRAKKSTEAQEPILKLQSQIRRVLYKKKALRSVTEAHSSEDAVKILQSVIRGSSVRQAHITKLQGLKEKESTFLELQTIARGGLSRKKLNHILDVLDYEDLRLQRLAAFAKGKLLRARVHKLKQSLQINTSSIIGVQSTVRGVLSRFGYDLFLDNLDLYSEDMTAFQASVRGYLYRQSKREVMKYYEGHLPSIIKIQSFIRGKYLGSAYKSLISMENPPLSVIKRFAYLLNDSDVDFEEEVSLTRIKESINAKTSSNEQLEKHISQLDLKIALLQKNKISLDELILQKNQSTNVPSNSNSGTIDVSSLNRRAKTRMESYEKLFYLLQTQPAYFTRWTRVDYRGVDVALKIFNNLQSKELPTREEYLFVRLIESTLSDFIINSHSVDDFQRHTTLAWQTLLRTFNETQHKVLKDIVGGIIENIMSNPEVNFESDPVLIYKQVKNTPKTLPVEKAIEDPDTKSVFISNLQQMREFGSEIFRAINDSIDKIPIHIKVLAKAAFKSSLKKFPQNVEQEHLANAGYVIINGFINLILESPDKFGIQPLDVSSNYKKNLRELSKFLIQLFIMKPFGSEHIYLQPLNKFINSSVDGVRSVIKSIIEIGEIDTVYNMSVYDDMTAHNRPKLTLRITDMLSIDKLIQKEINIIAPLADDTIREVLLEIQSNNASDISRLSGSYTLSLNPSSYKSSPEDTRVKSLFMQTKRCVLYLVQVQDDQNDLFELLKSKIDPIHELKFKQIINNEKNNIKFNHVNEYINDGQGFLGDLSKITYHKLKQIALERILELESIGKVTRKNSFQLLLNEIAYDIRTKHDQRSSRKKQLSIAENTLIRLDEKHNFLQDQLNAYNVHIDKSMEELQSKPTKSKRIMPFTKQFFYERELKRTGKVPKFGAYKYSSKKLYEKGILVDLRGLNQDLNSSNGSSFFGGFNFPKIDFMFNCDRAGIFTISSKSGTLAINGSLETLTIDQLLESQFENKAQIVLFDGMAKFDTNCLINFIFKKFYHYIEN